MALTHYVMGTFFTTNEFRLLVELAHKKIEALKEKEDELGKEQLEKQYQSLHQKLYSLTDHD